MDIVAGIVAATEALKLTKELRGLERELDKADLKLRLVELTDRLLEAKEALQDAKEERRMLLNQIAELKESARKKNLLQDEQGKLYEVDTAGNHVGEPFCNFCYIKEEKLYRMTLDTGWDSPQYLCYNCKNIYSA